MTKRRANSALSLAHATEEQVLEFWENTTRSISSTKQVLDAIKSKPENEQNRFESILGDVIFEKKEEYSSHVVDSLAILHKSSDTRKDFFYTISHLHEIQSRKINFPLCSTAMINLFRAILKVLLVGVEESFQRNEIFEAYLAFNIEKDYLDRVTTDIDDLLNECLADSKRASTLEILVKTCLSSKSVELRKSILGLIRDVCFVSQELSVIWIGILERAVLVDEISVSEEASSFMWEVLVKHPSLSTLENTPVGTPYELIQAGRSLSIRNDAVNGVTQLLAKDSRIDDTEELLCTLVEEYCSTSNQEALLLNLLEFFKNYHSNRSKHQGVIANAIVLMIATGVSDGLISYEGQVLDLRVLPRTKFLSQMLDPSKKELVVDTVISNISATFDQTWSSDVVMNLLT